MAPEFYDLCDRLGLLVMDESRQLGSDPQHLERLEGQLRRDRNHPSVGIWSIGNEEFEVQARPDGGRVASAKTLSRSRTVSSASSSR